MQTINLAQTADAYTDACTLIDTQAVQIGYACANEPVFMETLEQRRDVEQGSWSPEFYRAPETNTLLKCGGVRFRSALPGKPAVIVVQSVDRNDSVPGPGVPFTGTLSPSGGITPGSSSVQIQKDGVLVGAEPILDFLTTRGLAWILTDDPANTRITIGSGLIVGTVVGATGGVASGVGFTCVRNVPGGYTITFVPALTVPVMVFASLNDNSGNKLGILTANASGAGVQIQTYDGGTHVLQDASFNFIVVPI